MGKQVRFKHLQQRGIVDSWAQLRRLQEKHGFPLGRLLGPNTRTWDEDKEIEPWLASRPVTTPAHEKKRETASTVMRQVHRRRDEERARRQVKPVRSRSRRELQSADA